MERRNILIGQKERVRKQNEKNINADEKFFWSLKNGINLRNVVENLYYLYNYAAEETGESINYGVVITNVKKVIRRWRNMRTGLMKLMSIIIAVVMIVEMVPSISYNISANEESYSGKCGENVAWNLDIDTGILTISGNGAMDDMPDNWDDTSVYKKYKESINEIVIEKGITRVGSYAFNQCKKVEKITLPDGMLSIGNHAFWNCASLTNINLPAGVNEIGEGAFGYCRELKKLAIPYSITKIENRTFYACGFSNIILPDKITYIGDEAFQWCFLEYINIPKDVTEIGNNIFNMCSTLNYISVDEKNANFSSVDGVLYSKDKATLYKYPAGKTDKEFVMPKEVKTIEDGAMESIDYIEKITISDGVEMIGNNMFYNCQSLKEVNIPKSVKYLAEHIFIECTALEAINVDEANYMYCSEKGVLFDKKKITLIKYPDNRKETNYIIPDTVKIIGNNAFYESNVEHITIPQGVEIIEKWSFANCGKINEIEIPLSVKKINIYALYNSADIVKILNPNCEIIDYDEMDDSFGETIEGIIYGYANSTAEAFARKYDREFRDIITGDVIYNPNPEVSLYGWETYFGYNEDWYEGAEGELIEVTNDSWTAKLNMLGWGGIWGAHMSKSLETNLALGKKYTIKCNLKSMDCDKWIFITLQKAESIAYGKWIKLEKGVEKTINETFIAQNDADKVYFGFGGESKGGSSNFSREIYSFLEGGAEALDDEDSTLSTQIECRNISIVPTEVVATTKPIVISQTEKLTDKPKMTTSLSKPGKVLMSKLKNLKNNKVKLSWKKVKRVSGYQIMYAKDKKFEKGKKTVIAKTSAVSKTIKKLKKKKTYYFRIRAYRTVGGSKIYGAWSSVKKIKIKK